MMQEITKEAIVSLHLHIHFGDPSLYNTLSEFRHVVTMLACGNLAYKGYRGISIKY